MSFGRPGNASINFAATPPERGSFPLDHDGECKEFMVKYLQCMKGAKSQSTDCRHLSKEYLNCRMEKGLMERANWQDLGFQEGEGGEGKKPTAKHTQGPSPGLERS
ncbi:hypothetical protein BCR35DRAFT_263672 [Leucosporidium creatinivorum]|uniref:CHCH domain-containing protein n=1 Tax=Leucosporidium creatinivorum TaxID=106004 RepID=A0A1Y2FW76_9BASI|nr:hypothetical protein BCR35DRAFT_263672 [Leucosporidium creatinivorum]